MSTPLSDPNAALWASITPPANPTLTTTIRRRARAFSLDLLAQRLFLRFPETFSSRASARFGIIGAALVFAAGLGGLGYLTLSANPAFPSLVARAQSTVVESLRAVRSRGAAAARSEETTALAAASSTGLVRLGETVVEPLAPRHVAAPPVPAASVVSPASSTAAALGLSDTTAAAPAQRAALNADAPAPTAKAKRAAWKKKLRSSARRTLKSSAR